MTSYSCQRINTATTMDLLWNIGGTENQDLGKLEEVDTCARGGFMRGDRWYSPLCEPPPLEILHYKRVTRVLFVDIPRDIYSSNPDHTQQQMGT